MKYSIRKDSFVAYYSYKSNDTERFIVTIAHWCSLNDIQFIEIEYTDEGEIIHFYDLNNEELEEKIKNFKKDSLVENSFNEFVGFPGNDKLKELLQFYKDQGSDFEHKMNCSCAACSNYKFTIYRGDTIKRVLEDFKNIN